MQSKARLLAALLISALTLHADIDLDGVDDSVTMNALITSATTDITMTCWFFKRAQSENGTIMYNGTGSGDGYGIMVSNGSCAAGSLLVLQLGGISCNATSSTNLLTDDTWYHVALTRGATTWKIYINGAQITGTSTTNPNAPTGNLFAVGGVVAGSNCNGIFASAQFYTRELTAAEIASLYSAKQFRTLTGTGLKGWWWFDGGAQGTSPPPGTVLDHSGNGNHLTAAKNANATGCTWKGSSFITLP